jgi:hypothetical protein
MRRLGVLLMAVECIVGLAVGVRLPGLRLRAINHRRPRTTRPRHRTNVPEHPSRSQRRRGLSLRNEGFRAPLSESAIALATRGLSNRESRSDTTVRRCRSASGRQRESGPRGFGALDELGVHPPTSVRTSSVASAHADSHEPQLGRTGS